MRKRLFIPYRERDHGSFEEEWLPHKGVSGWWYITGYLVDSKDSNRIFSYQYTFLRARVYGITLKVLQLAFTDISEKKHFFKQKFTIFERKIFKDERRIDLSPHAVLERGESGITLLVNSEEFSLDLELDYGKGAVWHGENGVLIMGVPEDPKQRTVYFSYTNMPTEGKVVIKAGGSDRKFEVRGKSWFDRQWGPFSITDPATHWEWFSLRFFDDEEVMLFSFPQHPYQDGTYVDRDGRSRRIQDFTVNEKELIEVDGYTFSKGWDVILPGIKDERYEIVPVMDGQMNLAYFELMAEVLNTKGERVGYAFVELLPGVRNPNKKPSIRNLLRRL